MTTLACYTNNSSSNGKSGEGLVLKGLGVKLNYTLEEFSRILGKSLGKPQKLLSSSKNGIICSEPGGTERHI